MLFVSFSGTFGDVKGSPREVLCDGKGSQLRRATRASRVRASAESSDERDEVPCGAQPAPGPSAFHLAIPVHDMKLAREFYGGVLGLAEGRRDGDRWQDYALDGHQLVCHWVGEAYRGAEFVNPVDGDRVPVPHFGLALRSVNAFQSLAARVREHGVKFVVEPHLRFVGMPGEQYTMFFKDYSNNSLEFKVMTRPDFLFARYDISTEENTARS